MPDLILIQGIPASASARRPSPLPENEPVALTVSRTQLAKRRWRGVAEDGQEFGFDLLEPLHHGACFFERESQFYVVRQLPEEVLEVTCSTWEEAIHLAWNIGNLHLSLEVRPGSIRVVDEPTMRRFLQRENLEATCSLAVFLPVRASSLSASSASHSHSHFPGHGD